MFHLFVKDITFLAPKINNKIMDVTITTNNQIGSLNLLQPKYFIFVFHFFYIS